MINHYPEPCWSTPQEACPAPSAFYLSGPSPFMLSGVIQRLLQYHFSSPDNIEEPLLKGYIWSPSTACCSIEDEEKGSGLSFQPSRILIKQSFSKIGPEVQQLPSLLIQRADFKSSSIGVSISSPPGHNSFLNVNAEDNSVLVQGGHSIICKGATGAEAELLGQEVFYRLLEYSNVIQKDFSLGRLVIEGVSSLNMKKDDSYTSFYCVVNLSWSYIYRWSIVEESPILKRIALQQNYT